MNYIELEKKLKNVHDSKYNYKNIDKLERMSDLLEIVCPLHGIFSQRASQHLYQRQGCPECGGVKRLTTESFIKQSNEKHNGKYDYSLVDYKNIDSSVVIICPIHGEFNQLPRNHRKGHGCPKCAIDDARIRYARTLDEFICVSNEIHNNKYDYSLVDYKNEKTPVKIICPRHGEFMQAPLFHIHRKTGCPACAKTGFDPDKPVFLYYLYDKKTSLYKIGITNRTVTERFGNLSFDLKNKWFFNNGKKAREIERRILSKASSYRTINEERSKTYGGFTEFFKKDIYDIILEEVSK